MADKELSSYLRNNVKLVNVLNKCKILKTLPLLLVKYTLHIKCHQEYITYRMEGISGSGKNWRICSKTHIGARKFGASSHPQAKNYIAKLQSNFGAYH